MKHAVVFSVPMLTMAVWAADPKAQTNLVDHANALLIAPDIIAKTVMDDNPPAKARKLYPPSKYAFIKPGGRGHEGQNLRGRRARDVDAVDTHRPGRALLSVENGHGLRRGGHF